ncbi:MAG: hypothetical protein ABJB16_07825 [Saprospiraceae bacterium]
MASIKSIIIRPERRASPIRIHEAKINVKGIEGDHYAKADGNRQVTIIAEDQLAKMSAVIGFQGDAHLACRRNILIAIHCQRKILKVNTSHWEMML